ncbi:hypothetical protein ERD78_07135 [Allopusillimonas soli]|uniref:HipA-like C-terminal domain-containing protein n=1 Tax=Allopusillimonas soli TaxID=659016 RepID=A0A853FCQ2_9BURK|nr:hypothetical protein [Allopusillimonas soli]NYT36640.1 hypothetical protein [Allopusillimonas soli]TEA75125.1 hypothetical protein ERD78_07135 [Allopusillimonas soli]
MAEILVDQNAPIFELMSEPTIVVGDHINTVWRGLACPYGTNEAGAALIIKALLTPLALATELACAIAGRYLGLPVPAPSIVLCDPELLTQIPPGVLQGSLRTADGQLIYYGSQLIFEHPIRPTSTLNPKVIERIWAKVCANEVAPSGAAWDELVANPDRHHENLTYDGERWWLYDHDKALASLADLYARITETESRVAIVAHQAPRNQIASEMERRRCDMAQVGQRSKTMSRSAKGFDLLVSSVEKWQNSDVRVNSVLVLATDVLRSIGFRLPAIELLVEQRINTKQNLSLLWSEPDA